jgi:LysM domain
MAPRLIEVRQPKQNDVIGRDFTIAGFGTGFEATVLWQTAGHERSERGPGKHPRRGFHGSHPGLRPSSFGSWLHCPGGPHDASGFGDDPSGIHPPGPELNLVPVTLFTALEGFRLYEVASGDTLTKIAREQGQNTTVDDVFQANRDRINNPDLIFPGQILRIPLLA